MQRGRKQKYASMKATRIISLLIVGLLSVVWNANADPKPKKAGNLKVVDANGKKVGNVVASGGDIRRHIRVAFKHEKRIFSVVLVRDEALVSASLDGVEIYFESDDCTGQAYLEGNLERLVMLTTGVGGPERTVWVTDTSTTPPEVITAGSWLRETCDTSSLVIDPAYPATKLFNFYDHFTPPFTVR